MLLINSKTTFVIHQFQCQRSPSNLDIIIIIWTLDIKEKYRLWYKPFVHFFFTSNVFTMCNCKL